MKFVHPNRSELDVPCLVNRDETNPARTRRALLLGLAGFMGLIGLVAGCGSDGASASFDVAGAGGASAGIGATGGISAAGQSASGLGGSLVIIPNGGSTGTQGGNSGSDAAGSTATGGRMITQNCAATQASSTDETKLQPVDIIFAIDTSGSMAQETASVKANMNSFSKQIIDAGIDVHVILIAGQEGATPTQPVIGAAQGGICIAAPLGSGQCPADTKLPNFAHVPVTVGSRNALDLFISTFPMWKQHLRPDSTKAFVVVSDDNATDPPNNSASVFSSSVAALDPTLFKKWSFNGIYCFTQCAEAAAIGTVYVDLVAQTMGVSGDLCLQDFAPVFKKLAEKLITGTATTISCQWALPKPPAGQSFSVDLVQAQRTNATGASPLTRVNSAAECKPGGWYFDNLLNPTQIIACPETCSDIQNQAGGKVDVVYGCEEVGSCVATDSAAVSASQGGCEWPLPPPPNGQQLDFGSVNVLYTSASGFATSLGVVSASDQCAGVTNGWYYDNPMMPTKIVACPQTCTDVKAGGPGSKVEVLFGCKSKPAPPVIPK